MSEYLGLAIVLMVLFALLWKASKDKPPYDPNESDGWMQ